MRVILTFERKNAPFLVTYRKPNSRYFSSNEDTVPPKKVLTDEKHTRISYRRCSSDPQTLREREDFRRDTKYGTYRPLPDIPWLQLKQKTYLDDAERLYGRMEDWHRITDDALREKLVAILQDYLRDTCAATRLEMKDAKKYKWLCEISAQDYRSHIFDGAFHSVGRLREWASSVAERQLVVKKDNPVTNAVSDTQPNSQAFEHSASFDKAPSTGMGFRMNLETDSSFETDPEKIDISAQQQQERRKRRGEDAKLDNTPALSDLSESDLRRCPVSAFPFLRRRALEDEHSLDSSLVDWTAKYFPEDNKHTFEQPPKLRYDPSRATAGDSAQNESDGAFGDIRHASHSAIEENSDEDNHRIPRHHARHRLQRSLRSHEDRHRPTFDGEGVFYHIRNLSNEDERVPKARPVRGSDFMARPGMGSKVVKVPWNVVSTAKQQGHSHNILKAKERLARLSRGENPGTIP
ncbi:unnamed protein product [Phytomonas sp. Hart1]|nr:unnamed protein product [Phytomonas sp. Hart1]|eukprot:CCW68724.1 unnamed protein product [Phytomonas sp. isolate Hart1]